MITGELLTKFFRACNNGGFLAQLHSLTIKTGYAHQTLFAAKLTDLYAHLTPLRTARKLFDETPKRTLFVWSRMIKYYCRGKQYRESLVLFTQLFSSEKPDLYTVSVVVKACAGLKALDSGNAIHGFVKKFGTDLFVGSALIELYSKCGKMDDALCVFEEYSEPDTVLWTTMITGYEQNGDHVQAIEFFAQMVMVKQVIPDAITLVSLLSACAQILNLEAGRSVHGYMIRVGFDNGLSLLNALLSLYGKVGSVLAAAKLFDKMSERDVISWGSMISCYAHHGQAKEAVELFDEMVARGLEPNAVVLISALQACEAAGDVEKGKTIHKIAVRKGLESDILISTAIIDMYMNCSYPDEAIAVFDKMRERDGVSFSALLHGCVNNGRTHESTAIFRDMLANDFQPNVLDFVKILTSCSELGVLQQTSCIHCFLIRVGLNNNPFITASLIESYSKCGSLNDAIEVFSHTIDWDVVIWSSMLSAYGFHGKGHKALKLFHQMIENNPSVKPNDVTFLSILSACSHAGLTEEGIKIFNMMVEDYKIPPNSKHYGIIVDLLGRTGELHKAMEFIARIPEPVEANIWGALLGACRIHQNTEMGELAAKKLHELGACNVGDYILLSNMYAVDEKWDNAAEVRTLVKEKQLKRAWGRSVIEIRDEVFTFVANDRYCQGFEQIYALLNVLEGKMKEEHSGFNLGIY